MEVPNAKTVVPSNYRRGLSPLQKCVRDRESSFSKCIAVICILTYGSHVDSVDEYVKIDKSFAVECL